MTWLSCIASNVLLASLLAMAAWCLQRRLRRPAIAHILWVLVLIKLVTPPLVSVPLLESPPAAACVQGSCGSAEHVQTPDFVNDILPWTLLAVWSIGAGATGGIAWRRWSRFQGLLAHALPAPPEWQSLAARLASELSLRRPPEILAVPGRLPPLVVPGRPRPLLLLPMELMNQLGDSQRGTLLLHELVHLKRGDHWVRLLELTVGAAFWWLPVVGLIGRQLRACEEACCDAAVVAHRPEERRDYARLLLDVFDFASPLPAMPQATAMSAADGLEQRLLMILDANRSMRRTWPATALVAALACLILPCGLHCDFAASPRPLATAAEPTPSSSGYRAVKSFEGCCPRS